MSFISIFNFGRAVPRLSRTGNLSLLHSPYTAEARARNGLEHRLACKWLIIRGIRTVAGKSQLLVYRQFCVKCVDALSAQLVEFGIESYVDPICNPTWQKHGHLSCNVISVVQVLC